MEIHEAFHIKSLIIKYKKGAISEKEKEILEQWAESAPENCNLLEYIRSDRFMQEVMADESALEREQWEKLRRKTTGTPRRLRMRFLRYAAAVLVPVAIGSAIWLLRPDMPGAPPVPSLPASGVRIELANGNVIPLGKDSDTNFQAEGTAFRNNRDSLQITRTETAPKNSRWNRVIVPKGTDYIVQLEDGSNIHLNAESTLEVPVSFNAKERRIRLSGEAYMNIRHEKDRPFIVETGNSHIRVLGTQFNLRAYPTEQKVSTTLVHGSVEVSSGSRKALLQPGMQATVSPDGGISLQTVNILRHTAWRDRRLVFENEYITDIIEELKHWYDYDFIITDPAVREVRLSMNTERPDNFNDLKADIEKIDKIHFQINGRIVRVTK